MNESKTTRVNRSKESVIWKSDIINSGTDIINLEQAGTTFPDKDYTIHRSRKQMRVYDNLFVIEYVVSGIGYIESEGNRVRVSAGDLYIIHRRTVHSYYADKEQPFLKKWINVSGTFVNGIAEAFFDDGPFTVLPLGKSGEQIIDSIHSVLESGTRDMTVINNTVMRQLLELCIAIEEYRKSTNKSPSLFEQITQYICKNISSDLTVTKICDKFYTSPTTLYRIFMSNSGMSPKSYIQAQKIQAAKRMISDNDTTFNIIAASLGFYDSHHFFRVFRQVTGMSPTEYKKELFKED